MWWIPIAKAVGSIAAKNNKMKAIEKKRINVEGSKGNNINSSRQQGYQRPTGGNGKHQSGLIDNIMKMKDAISPEKEPEDYKKYRLKMNGGK